MRDVVAAAKEWREKHGYTFMGGVVLVFKGCAFGWMDKLRDPEGCEPGAIAVAKDGTCHEAVGGNPYDGAKRWKLCE